MTSATPFLTTESGVATSYLPLTTAWASAGPDCASGVYQQIGGTFLGWDPWYAQNVDNRLSTCWPPEASTWWSQSAQPTTVLGPVFTCPEAYFEAYTTTLDSQTKQTICCPSNYKLNVVNFAATFPSQCTSTLTAGQSLSWFRLSDQASTSTVIPDSTTLTVYGWHLNGLNVVASSTATSTGSTVTDTTGATSTPISTSSAAAASTASAAASTGNNSSNVGVIIGATVGVVLGVLLVALGAFLVWRKRRAGRGRGRGPEQPKAMEAYSTLAAESQAPSSLRSELPAINRPAELNASSNVYELPH